MKSMRLPKSRKQNRRDVVTRVLDMLVGWLSRAVELQRLVKSSEFRQLLESIRRGRIVLRRWFWATADIRGRRSVGKAIGNIFFMTTYFAVGVVISVQAVYAGALSIFTTSVGLGNRAAGLGLCFLCMVASTVYFRFAGRHRKAALRGFFHRPPGTGKTVST